MTAHFTYSRSPARQWLALSGWVFLFCGGCASRGHLESLEAELRQHQDAMLRAENKSVELESQLALARRETELIRSQMASSGGAAPLPEQSGNLVRLSDLKINTLLSGGKDRDGQPGDDVLVALISPLDEQGDLVKIAGEIEIEAFDMTRPSEDKRVGRWTFDTEQAAKAWHSGFVGAGLQFELPWQDIPTSKELLVHARLKTVDGRQFDTSTPLKVVPPLSSAPALLPLPAVQPVKFESPKKADRQVRTADQVVIDPPMARPVPFYDALEPIERPRPPVDANTKKGSAKPLPPQVPGRATLHGVETSDRWTDETLPRLR